MATSAELPPADAGDDALAVALRLSSASLQSVDASASLYDDPRVKVDVAADLTVLVAFQQQIWSVGVQEDVESRQSDGQQSAASLRVIVPESDLHLEEGETVSDVKWLDRELFCAGYSSGVLRIFNRVGKLLFEQKLHGAAVLKLDVNRNASTMVTPRRASVLLSSEPDLEGELWLLYADSTVAIIQISELIGKMNSAVFGPAQASKFRKYCLRDQKDVMAAIPCGPYFTQNKLQEENFLLHQIIGGLQAFVKKKRVDAAHTLEQDALDPLLDDIGNLSSSTTIQTLLDVLLNPDMVLLNATFLLRALEKLQLALKNGMSSRTPTGSELLLQWKLLWQHRLVSTFIGFQAEFERGKRMLLSAAQTSTGDVISRSSAKEQQSGPLLRITPWLELFRRAGLTLDDESCARTQKAIDRASHVTAWEFLDFFSMPFSDPDLPRRRDILSLFEVAETKEEFLRELFRTLKTPIFRKFSTAAQRDCLFTLILAPVLSSVFAVQELQQLHSAIFLTEEVLTRLFIEWYFSLPLGAVLALPPPSLSSSLQRWLQPYFVIADTEAAIQQEEEDDAVKAMSAAKVISRASNPDEGEIDNDDDDEDDSDESDGDDDDDDDENLSRITAFKMGNLSRTVKWRCRVKDLRLSFEQRWPPSHDTSALMQTLNNFKSDTVSVAQITDHVSLIMLLDSFAATAVTPISIVKLFSNNGRHLCRPESFLMPKPGAQPSDAEMESVRRDRTRFLKELLRHDEKLGFALTEAFGLPLDVIREEYVLLLYQSGRDERADLAIEKMQFPERMVSKLGAIARARLSLILRRMKTEAEYAVLMSMLPADVFTWVTSDTLPPLVADPMVEKLDLTPSLTSTHYLLLKCLALISSPTGEEFEKVSAMSVLVKDVINQVKLHS
ncbi:Rab3 GTPase-activating protein non-catalytic subunit [Phytophthora boehmeriae]|uniref:Rab3 GTPase-activating protein non-catalytic subunit n=1 Tax=Phytophthora boehmeriae TaxID=109152 RepID=A0A8T1WUN0_9STRA|nr:Rab3 GTPase-activating protein non-catalytic subunit [Phytophthora boehmeriae]